MTSLPIRLRLTVWYSVLFATAAILLSSTSWWMLHRTIDANVQQEFQERIDDVRMQLHQFGITSPNQAGSEIGAQLGSIYHYRDDGKWLQIRDQDEHWIYRSARMISLDAPLSSPNSIASSGIVGEFKQGGRTVRTFSVPVLVDGRTYTVEIGTSMNKPETLLRRFGLGLLLLTPAVLVVAILAGHLMSRKALAPVAAIAHEARRISDRNLDQRLPVSRANDELTHLAVTLNNMLVRIDTGFRSVRDFTANASHELRTPIARLRTEVEIALLRPRSADEYRETLGRLQETAFDITGLMDSLLALARAEAGADTLRMTSVDLQRIVQKTLIEWTGITKRLSIDLDCGWITSTVLPQPLFVLGEAQALSRLLRILLDNACKFTPPGGKVSVLVEIERDTVLLAVQDSGIGIPIDEQERIFERFYKVEGDQTKQKGGSGLGLSLAVWIAEQHNATITVTSAEGKGSKFAVKLPRAHRKEVSSPDVLESPSTVDASVA